MSEEEIIDIVKEIKSHQVAFYEPKEHKQILKNYFTQEQRDAIQGLLDLYQAEKENNKELDRENQALYESINCDDNTMLAKLYQKEKEKNKELEMQLLEKDLYIDGLKEDRRIAIKEIQEEYYISKDKIKEKMKQDIYTNEHTILGGRRNGKTLEYGIRLGRIQVCEELLEERK